MPGSTAYPGAIDAFLNPDASAGNKLGTVAVPHDAQHGSANDAIEAIETVLGTNPHVIDAAVVLDTTPETVREKTDQLYRLVAEVKGVAWDVGAGIDFQDIIALFDATTGHTHDGSAGEGGPVPAPATASHNHTATAGDGGVLTDDEHDGFIELVEIASPTAPAANKMRLYAKDVAGITKLYAKDSAGTDTDLGATGGGGGGGTPNWQYTAPTDASFAWLNQSGASKTVEGTGWITLAKTLASAAGISGREINKPGAAPWIVTMAFRPTNAVPLNTGASYGSGIFLRDSVGGKILAFNFWSGNIQTFRADRLTNATTFGTSVGTSGDWTRDMKNHDGIYFVQVFDDNTNVGFKVSDDGIYWDTWYSEGRTANFGTAPDKIGFHVYDNTRTGGIQRCQLVHYDAAGGNIAYA